ncbi:MAG: CopG family transcriptional regulator [Actinomycetota bacterium]
MERTQIYLGRDEMELLSREARRSGSSRSELIRRAVRAQYGKQEPESRKAALRASAGAWRNFPLSGAEYVDTVREDLNRRLARLGLP